jgi:hypothetical protein
LQISLPLTELTGMLFLWVQASPLTGSVHSFWRASQALSLSDGSGSVAFFDIGGDTLPRFEPNHTVTGEKHEAVFFV